MRIRVKADREGFTAYLDKDDRGEFEYPPTGFGFSPEEAIGSLVIHWGATSLNCPVELDRGAEMFKAKAHEDLLRAIKSNAPSLL